MIFLFGERTRSKSAAVGHRECAVCRGAMLFTEQTESSWFSFFGIPLLPIEQLANYWRCENCFSAYKPNQLEAPSSVPIVKRISLYLLLGYQQQQHTRVAQEITLKLCGIELDEVECSALIKELNSGKVDMVEFVAGEAASLNTIGKQQVIEASFLATHACCELQYEDRLRINLIGNALGVGIEFVSYAIAESRKKNNYGIRRLRHLEAEI